jgi:hypothetical protein
MKKIGLFLLLLFANTSFASSMHAPNPLKFEAPEHYLLASNIKLSLDENGEKILIPGNELELRNYAIKGDKYQGQFLKFSDFIWLSDFIANPEINLGSLDHQANLKAFDENFDFVFSDPQQDYIGPVRDIVYEQLERNHEAIEKHQPLTILDEDNARFNCSTGGGCGNDYLLNYGLYMKISVANYDHFGTAAANAYLAGHQKAMELAQQATSREELEKAYAYEGYADHYLVDLFAAGHLRTPRTDLPEFCKSQTWYPEKIGKAVGDYLTLIMHDKENDKGITIFNTLGEQWKGYGDKKLFIDDNKSNFDHMVTALQTSVDQVYKAYKRQSQGEAFNMNAELEEIKKQLPDIEKIRSNNKSEPLLFKQEDGNFYENVASDNEDANYEEVTSCYLTALKYGFKESK